MVDDEEAYFLRMANLQLTTVTEEFSEKEMRVFRYTVELTEDDLFLAPASHLAKIRQPAPPRP